jgi:hypothetical protein
MNMAEPAQFMQAPTQPLRGELRSDVSMSRHVSWRAGGRADRVYIPADLDDLASFMRTLPEAEPLLVVGLGSNLLVRDGGFRGTVVLLLLLTQLKNTQMICSKQLVKVNHITLLKEQHREGLLSLKRQLLFRDQSCLLVQLQEKQQRTLLHSNNLMRLQTHHFTLVHYDVKANIHLR